MQRHCDNVSERPIRCSMAAGTYYLAARSPVGAWAYRVVTPQVVERKIS